MNLIEHVRIIRLNRKSSIILAELNNEEFSFLFEFAKFSNFTFFNIFINKRVFQVLILINES